MHEENAAGVCSQSQAESSDTQKPIKRQLRKRPSRHRRTEALIRQHTKKYEGEDARDDI